MKNALWNWNTTEAQRSRLAQRQNQERTSSSGQIRLQNNRGPGTLVGLAPEEALDQAVAYMTREGASVTGRAEDSVSFTYRKGPNLLLLLLLLLMLFLPGILYWMAASRSVNFSITATRTEGGCRLLFGGEYGAGHDHFKRWVKTLPKPDPTLTITEAEPTRAAAPNIPEEIRRLAELRDEGILTNEEFEAKKRDLLDRM